MKLVIDIPETTYINLCNGHFDSAVIRQAVTNGTPLEEEKECATCKYHGTPFDEEPCSWCGNDCRNYERG